MIIKKINLKNFRQYYDEVEIKFAFDEKRNVTIIHAENGVGKTALLNAIKWCFYGNFTDNFRNPGDLVNIEAKKEGKSSCAVEIVFDHAGEEFLIIRRFTESVHGGKSNLGGEVRVFKVIEGTLSPQLPDPDHVINGILPREMADYFFFQGEGSNAVETGNRGINLAKSIRNILGFSVAESVKDILRKKINLINKKIAGLDTSGEAEKLADQLFELEEEKVSYEIKIRDLNDLIPSLQLDYELVNSDLEKINNADLNKLRQDERELANKIPKIRQAIQSAISEKYTITAKYGFAVFGREFASESLDFIDESTLKGRLPEPYNKTFVEDILAKRACICGRDLKHGSDGYINVAKLLDKAANPGLQSRLGAIRAQIENIRTLSSDAKDSITKVIANYNSLEGQLKKSNSMLTNISNKIKEIPVDKISELQFKKIKIMQDLKNQTEMLGSYKTRLEGCQRRVEEKKREMERLTPNSKNLESLNLFKDFLGALLEELSNHLNRTENGIRKHVASKVNEMMKSFSRHSYEIRIHEKDFTIQLVTTDGTPVGQGDGLNLLLNLSITAALIEFVRERQRVKDPLLTSASAAPLVIDAPFGVLDDTYRNVVIKNLPEHVEQVMFFVSSSQWRPEMNDEIKDRIGAEYCLVLEVKELQGEKKVDIFNINGEEIVASRYGCERDRVLAKEIIL